MENTIVLTLLLLVSLWPQLVVASELIPPPLMLAKVYNKGIDVSQYYVSEKLDGVRAYWNGRQLLTRSGRPVNAPAWFLSALPKNPLDGELWAGRGQFSFVSGLVRRHQADDEDWMKVKYMVFDLPQMAAPFTERLWVLRTLVAQQANPQLKVLDQTKIGSEQELEKKLQMITAAGGEGLMLRRSQSLYQVARSDDLLKLKLSEDGEAEVVGYVPGEGKYRGALGALVVRTADGREFRLGTGFSDDERFSPPPLGAQVTFSYNGLTEHGLPRFARFVRVRPQE
ncbi:DNA ligase [Thalassolituus hydrocarboniclasticus]|uniref:DNA ligase n=1 Tax=Thalassolituus hydrocarboniclasticus TaxID=2742796 RepID=A0ABY6ABU8_9GAMM|nr:DNA ligase [Thalassolituus hydrocarboniclasticus]UXD88053.1 DNA ligase [Thalassolituus hydrocarboniclasticus]